MHHRILLLIILLSPFNLLAQKETTNSSLENRVGIQVGLNKSLLKDSNFSPLNYGGAGTGVTLFYERKNKNNRIFSTTVSYFSTKIQSGDLLSTKSLLQKLDVECVYLQQLKAFNNSKELYLGGMLSSHLNIVDFDDFEAISYFNFHGLSLVGCLSYKIKEEQQITISISIPTVGVLVRPVPTGWNKDVIESTTLDVLYSGEVATINKFFGIAWTNMYRYELSEKMDLTIQVRVNYVKTSLPKMIVNINSQFSIGTNFKL